MTFLDVLPWILLTLAGIALSALFSGIETGLYTLSGLRLAVRAGQGDPSALRLRNELNHPSRLLSTLLVGNNLANFAGSYGIAAILTGFGLSPGKAVVVNALLLIPILFIFCETLPKDLFRTYTDRWTYRWSGYLVAWRWILTVTGLVPLVQFVGQVVARLAGVRATADPSARMRIAQLIKEGTRAGVISESQVTLAERGLSLRERTVASVMQPWRSVISVREDTPYRQVEMIARQRTASRLPVIDANGRVVGVLRLIDSLLEPERSVRELMREPVLLSPTTPALEAIRRLREARTHLGVVTAGGPGRPIGVVTINDLAGPLAGQITEAPPDTPTASAPHAATSATSPAAPPGPEPPARRTP